MTSNPLAFLPTKGAEQFQVSCYLYVTGLVIIVWDWCITIEDEYKMLQKRRLSIPVIVYFSSRIGVLGYAVAANIFQLAAVGHCQALIYITGGLLIVGNCSTTLLFLFRLWAVYHDLKIMTGFFSILWVVHMGLTVMVPLSLKGEVMGPTNRCYSTPLRPIPSISIVLGLVYDTLVFLAISFRIASHTVTSNNSDWRIRMRCFFTAGGLPRLSSNLLHGGQLYYFVSVLVNSGTCILVFLPNIPPFYRALLAVPSVTLPSVMACRVFRDTRLEFIQDSHSSSFLGTTPVFTEVNFASQCDIPLTNLAIHGPRGCPANTSKETFVKEDARHICTEQAPPGEWLLEHASDGV